MKPQALNLRIGRLVIDAPLGEGVNAAALAEAVRSELASRMLPQSAEPPLATPYSRTAAPLARIIAEGIAGKIGAMNSGIGAKPRGGGDGSL